MQPILPSVSRSQNPLDATEEDLKNMKRILRPRKHNKVGFLGFGENLKALCQLDAQTLQALGITHQQMGAKLDEITNLALMLLNQNGRDSGVVLLGERWKVTLLKGENSNFCPFSCGRIVEETDGYDLRLENLSTHEAIRYKSVVGHLIAEHHFFVGKKTIHRVEPAEVCRILELQPGKIDLRPTKPHRIYDFRQTLEYDPLQKVLLTLPFADRHQMTPHTTAYLIKDSRHFFSPSRPGYEREGQLLIVNPTKEKLPTYPTLFGFPCRLHLFTEEPEVSLYDCRLQQRPILTPSDRVEEVETIVAFLDSTVAEKAYQEAYDRKVRHATAISNYLYFPAGKTHGNVSTIDFPQGLFQDTVARAREALNLSDSGSESFSD